MRQEAERSRQERYPLLEVDLKAVKNNAQRVCTLCGESGITVAGVIKFSDGDVKIAQAYLDGGCRQIASSRIVHLQRIRRELPNAQTMLIRIPMLSEVEDVVSFSDISLNSDEAVLRALNDAAGAKGTIHGVVLMLDVGDRREGICEADALVDLALAVERQMPHLHLAGIGSSFACMSGVLPDWDNLSELAGCAQRIEDAIGRPLEIVSGGSSITLTLLAAGKPIPAKINHLRIGGVIANSMGIRINRGVHIDGMREDAFRLTAQIVEVQRKPSPAPGSGKNWAGQAVEFKDRGIRIRAILALGSQDIGNALQLVPEESGISVEGGSSDHTVLDVTDSDREWKTGDLIRFRLFYMPLLYCFATRHVHIQYVSEEAAAK